APEPRPDLNGRRAAPPMPRKEPGWFPRPDPIPPPRHRSRSAAPPATDGPDPAAGARPAAARARDTDVASRRVPGHRTLPRPGPAPRREAPTPPRSAPNAGPARTHPAVPV